MIGFVFILYNDLPSDPVEAQKIVGNQPLGVNLIPCGYFYHAAFYSHTPHPSSLLPRTLHAHCSGTRPPLSPPQPPTVCVQLVPPPMCNWPSCTIHHPTPAPFQDPGTSFCVACSRFTASFLSSSTLSKLCCRRVSLSCNVTILSRKDINRMQIVYKYWRILKFGSCIYTPLFERQTYFSNSGRHKSLSISNKHSLVSLHFQIW